jgi:hypothetical protein
MGSCSSLRTQLCGQKNSPFFCFHFFESQKGSFLPGSGRTQWKLINQIVYVGWTLRLPNRMVRYRETPPDRAVPFSEKGQTMISQDKLGTNKQKKASLTQEVVFLRCATSWLQAARSLGSPISASAAVGCRLRAHGRGGVAVSGNGPSRELASAAGAREWFCRRLRALVRKRLLFARRSLLI